MILAIELNSIPIAFPLYFRDDDTIEDFRRGGNFFGCMDHCDQEFVLRRIVILVPLAVICKLP